MRRPSMKVQRKVQPKRSNVEVDKKGLRSNLQADMYFHLTVASLVDGRRRNVLDAYLAPSVRDKVSTHPFLRKHAGFGTF